MSDDPLEAWCRGFVAGCDACPTDIRPYTAGSELAAVWDDGWRAGEQSYNRSGDSRAKDLDEWWAGMLHSGRPARSH